MNKHKRHTTGNFGPGTTNLSYSSAVSGFSTQRAAGPSGNPHPALAGGNCPGNKEELKSWGISLQRKAGTPPSLSSFYLPCASSLLTPFPVSQKALSSLLCSLRDYFHAWAMHAAATPMITLNVEVFNLFLTRFLFSHTSQEATSQASVMQDKLMKQDFESWTS